MYNKKTKDERKEKKIRYTIHFFSDTLVYTKYKSISKLKGE